MAKSASAAIICSSGNVFADMGLTRGYFHEAGDERN